MYDDISGNELREILLGFQYGQVRLHTTAVEMSKERGHKSLCPTALHSGYDKEDLLGLRTHRSTEPGGSRPTDLTGLSILGTDLIPPRIIQVRNKSGDFSTRLDGADQRISKSAGTAALL